MIKKKSEAEVDAFRHDLGPFVVAAEKTRMPMIFTDNKATYSVVFANDAFLALTGYKREEILAKSFQSLLTIGCDQTTVEIVEAALRGEGCAEPELHYKRKDGTEFWASLYVSPVCDDNGTIVQQFLSLIDVTRLRQDNARCRLLIDELNHRVKNTLATVQSIVTQALRSSGEPEAIRDAIESRILALSRSHDLLTISKWEGVGLHDLVDTALHPFEVIAGHTQRFTISGDNFHLSPKVTLSLTIALHELATNAVKYGAFSVDAGLITVSWELVPDVAGDRLVLRWQEHGGPPVTPPTHKGFGSWVIERGLAHELDGIVTLNFLESGVACTIDIPAPVSSET
ncbi:HWE histidine kinase domain-containing protein [Sphingobium sp. Ant17]|uniref:HWE histidine kinase domain-containing protein n=1 Tax=Sphingobium sp. Ant17 TaxID=1461752 RepID=UPI00044AA6CC|nr:HWE histidine kinase domain-containing protein [Sphingobium sp. Ant17]EXS68725.1 histidine kinase [Sphingobium sp. Ant17]